MNVLHDILEHKRQEVANQKRAVPLEALRDSIFFHRQTFSLKNALVGKAMAIIAEVKKASPSKDVIREVFDPESIARSYVEHGANAISVLTDQKFFRGDPSIISAIRPAVPIPILRKDFIIDEYQLDESKSIGADAVLLIVAALEPGALRDFHGRAHDLGLETLVEVHGERELEILDSVVPDVLGINNRDLSTFAVDLGTTERVMRHVPAEMVIVSESGISSAADLGRLQQMGVHAALIGEALMRAEDPGAALQALFMRSQKT
jgi:indole-3-glycerol phosphate synthase